MEDWRHLHLGALTGEGTEGGTRSAMVCVAVARVAMSASTSAQLSSHTVGGAAAAASAAPPARDSDRRSRLPSKPVLDEEDATQRSTFQSKSRSAAGAGTLSEGVDAGEGADTGAGAAALVAMTR